LLYVPVVLTLGLVLIWKPVTFCKGKYTAIITSDTFNKHKVDGSILVKELDFNYLPILRIGNNTSFEIGCGF